MIVHQDFQTALPELTLPVILPALTDPQILMINDELCDEFDFILPQITHQILQIAHDPACANHLHPIAQPYASYHFGTYIPIMGDSQGVLLGELTNSLGNLYDCYVSGWASTPFDTASTPLLLSEGLHEYLISESLHNLGVPTSRILAIITTGQGETDHDCPVILIRLSSSHIRLGTFCYVAAQAKATQDLTLLRRLADYTIDRHYPSVGHTPHPYRGFFEAVIRAQALLMAEWMLNGFIHGDMDIHTSLVSAEGLQYHYSQFLGPYDRAKTTNPDDVHHSYCYANQPLVTQWNLARFSETLLPLFDSDESHALDYAVEALERFMPQYHAEWALGMRAKFGLSADTDSRGVAELIDQAMILLEQHHIDYTEFFLALTNAASGNHTHLDQLFNHHQDYVHWYKSWDARHPDPQIMIRINPTYRSAYQILSTAYGADLLKKNPTATSLISSLRVPYRAQY